MNKPITAKEMSKWINKTWKRAQDEAWESLKKKLEKPETLEVFKRMKDR